MHLHTMRNRPAGAISPSDSGAANDFPVDNLIDDRASTLFKWASSETDPSLILDLGNAPFQEGIDRLIIPANHNIDSIKIVQDTLSGFGSPTTLHDTDTSITPGVLYDSGTFDGQASDEQWLRIEIVGTKVFQIPQLYLTTTYTPVRGPNLQDSTDENRDNVLRIVQPTGQSPTVQLGPQQRIIVYDYESPLDGADLVAMEAFIDAVGLAQPFFIDPAVFTPFSDEPPLLVKLEAMPTVRNSILVPASGARSKTFSFSLIESVD